MLPGWQELHYRYGENACFGTLKRKSQVRYALPAFWPQPAYSRLETGSSGGFLAKMPRIKRWPLLLALLALALPPLCPAQTQAELGMPVLHNYAPREYGGYDSAIWNILQDRRGVLYFGAANMVLEYDGVTWRKIAVPSAVVRSLAMDATGKIWVGAYGDFGYLEPDANGTLHYASLGDKIPPEQRNFSDVWQVLITPQGNFFRSYERLFRWDGQRMHGWVTQTRFEALSEVRGHIYTSQKGVGLEEIVGDDLRPLPGGDAYMNSRQAVSAPLRRRAHSGLCPERNAHPL